MRDDQTAELQELIDRVNQGDDEARMQLIESAYEHLHHLSAMILHRSFPRLKVAPSLVDTADVADELVLQLQHALAEVRPATVQDFFRLAAQRIRWLLLDLARQTECGGQLTLDDWRWVEGHEDAVRSFPPAALAELYLEIEGLPARERDVVELLYFHGLSQAETAAQMGVTERTVRRYWTVARLRLFEALKETLPPPVRR